MGIELEILAVFLLQTVGTSVFAVFEVETEPWRKALKWTLVLLLTLGLHALVGHWALLLPLGLAAAGLAFHLWWCRRHGIHPLRATPRRRYYELRGWPWVEGPEGGGCP